MLQFLADTTAHLAKLLAPFMHLLFLPACPLQFEAGPMLAVALAP